MMTKLWNRTRSGERGFTIVELMVAVFIGGILFAIALPTVQNYTASQQLRGRAREVQDTLRAARNLAMDEGVPRYVLFAPGPPTTYRLYRFDDATDTWIAERPAVELEGVTFTAADITLPALATAAGCEDPPADPDGVPADAAYFNTRGRYPVDHDPFFPPLCPTITGTFTITLHGGLGKTRTLTLHAQTGQVTGG